MDSIVFAKAQSCCTAPERCMLPFWMTHVPVPRWLFAALQEPPSFVSCCTLVSRELVRLMRILNPGTTGKTIKRAASKDTSSLKIWSSKGRCVRLSLKHAS